MSVIRGIPVTIKQKFTDPNSGTVITPVTVVMDLRYRQSLLKSTTHQFIMHYNSADQSYYATWDTRGAYPCTATYCIYSTDPPLEPRYEGNITLTANSANPQNYPDTPEYLTYSSLDVTDPNSTGLIYFFGMA